MIVRDKPSVVSQLYMQRLSGAAGQERRTNPAVAGKHDQDGVEISAEALALQRAADTARSTDEVRWEKVRQLKQQIEQGDYEVPVEDLAGRLLGEA